MREKYLCKIFNEFTMYQKEKMFCRFDRKMAFVKINFKNAYFLTRFSQYEKSPLTGAMAVYGQG